MKKTWKFKSLRSILSLAAVGGRNIGGAVQVG